MLGLGLGLPQRVAFGRRLSELQSLINDLFGAGQQGGLYSSKPVVDGVQVLWQDAAGTTPVTADGNPVGRRDDLSGNGNHQTQSTAAGKPLYRTDGTLHWLEYDGVDDSTRSGVVVPSDNVAQLFSGYTADASTADNIQFIINMGGTSNGALWIEARDGQDRAQYLNDGTLVSAAQSSLSFPRTRVLTGLFSHDAPYASLRVDGQQVAENTSGITGGTFTETSGIASGVQENADTRYLDGRSYVDIVRFGAELSESDLIRVEQYIADMQGRTL